MPNPLVVPAAIFQFHKGTIKTVIDVTTDCDDDYFNSIKVRLKRIKTSR